MHWHWFKKLVENKISRKAYMCGNSISKHNLEWTFNGESVSKIYLCDDCWQPNNCHYYVKDLLCGNEVGCELLFSFFAHVCSTARITALMATCLTNVVSMPTPKHLLPTLMSSNLPILGGIQAAELRRNGATLSLGRPAMEPGHLLHSALTRPSSVDARHLKSRHPVLPTAQQLISFCDNNKRAAQWEDH